LKKYLFVVALIALVVLSSGCTTNQNQTNQSQIPTKTYAANGISFQYPDTWNLTDKSTANATLITIKSPDVQLTNGNATKGYLVSILKQAIPKGVNITTANITDTLSNTAKQSGLNATNETVNIAGVTATKISFNQTIQNATGNVWIIAFEKNNNIYSLTFASVEEDLQTAKQNFDIIINSFKID
jgi:PsbP-like protein